MDYEKLYKRLINELESWRRTCLSAETAVTLALILREARLREEKEG